MTAFDDMRDALFEDDNQSEAVAWAGLDGVRVIRREMDDVVVTPGGVGQLQRARLFQVRQSDVAAPANGDLVGATDATFKVIAKPQLEEGVWTCEVKPL